MMRSILSLILVTQIAAPALARNFDIVNHPRYQHLKNKNTPTKSKQDGISLNFSVAERSFKKFYVLTLDTRDQAICQHYADRLNRSGSLKNQQASDICQIDSENPYVSIAMDPSVSQGQGFKYSDLTEREQKLVRETRNFTLPAVGMMALLFALPKSFTGWDDFGAEGLGEKWKSNVKAGPVVDEDKWAVNYIGHPYAGAAYYVVARHAGFTRTESFAYSAFMSTFFWEYGIESFAEIPSIQDLILTPVLGSILGEFFIQGAEKVRQNNGEVLGSRFLGSTSLFLMDPASGILDASERILSHSPFQDAEFNVYAQPNPKSQETRVGFNLVLWLKKK